VIAGAIVAFFYTRHKKIKMGAMTDLAVMGLLLAFGVMHPNAVIMLLIPPIPMKAKWFVVVYGVIELFFGISGRMDGVAHFAHVGGMLWGFLLLYYWKHKGVIRY
jgi:membrane associated rhomboid family serine protease